MYVSVFLAHMSVYHMYTWFPSEFRRGLLKLELRTVVSCPVDARN